MKSSSSLALVAAAVLAASLGLKAVRTAPTSGPPHRLGQGARSAALGRFLAANVSPVAPVASGWSFDRDGCHFLAFPSSERGTLDMTAMARAGPGDRVAYVYRGRVSDTRPTYAYAFDVMAYLAARSFRRASEPGYVILIARQCRTLPALPWDELPA